jgi:hypothetical protein
MTKEEANRQMAEDKRRAIREDPLVIAPRKAAEERYKQAASRCYSLTFLVQAFSEVRSHEEAGDLLRVSRFLFGQPFLMEKS